MTKQIELIKVFSEEYNRGTVILMSELKAWNAKGWKKVGNVFKSKTAREAEVLVAPSIDEPKSDPLQDEINKLK